MDLTTDSLSMDPALAGGLAENNLLATLSAADRALLATGMRIVTLEAGAHLLHAGDDVSTTYFPFDGLIISMQIRLEGSRAVEVASIGKEGAIGGIISCGTAPAFTDATVQLGGRAIAVPTALIEEVKAGSAHVKNLFCRYSDALLSQVMQSVACNAFHPIEARAARWLLHAQDRAGGDRLALTQESLAGLLGVQRTTVNAVARVLQEQGLIAYRRGAVQVVDRAGLARVSCSCYNAVDAHFRRVLGSNGRGD